MRDLSDMTTDDRPPAVSPAQTDRTLWGEVCAVLAVGVVPHLLSAGITLRIPPESPLPYWIDAIQLTVLSGCTIYVTLYLIHRGGESWERFGMPRPSLWDVLLGVGLLFASMALWFWCGLVAWGTGATSDYSYSLPETPADYALMVPKFGASAFSEELVTRVYLITRFEYLLRSRGSAVVLSAVLFATYHGYQGVVGLVDTMAFGLVYGVAFLLFRRVWPLAIGHALFNIYLELAA
jgi:membrane protease YdiL (CAAX protease family)